MRFKPYLSLVLFSLLMLFSSCSGDDDSSFWLSHDSNNVDAPGLPSGSYLAAARFNTLGLRSHVGKSLREVRFYIKEVPENCRVVLLSDANGNQEVLHESEILSVREESWNRYTLPIDFKILENRDLWIAIEFEHIIPQRVLGCDQGPADPDGDWLYTSSDRRWLPLNRRFPEITINWNIRGRIE
jgi:hypothetical protein